MKFGSIVLFLMIVVGFSGCYLGPKNYEIFAKLNDGVVERKTSMQYFTLFYTKEEYNNEEYIYIRNNHKRDNEPKECVYGFVAKKNDPNQIVIRWEILSDKEFCVSQQQWIFSF
ncbi:hypothetical protein U5B43_10320 [Campylobacter sp. 9BO]|uniref:hypothetical protein n=1 Tax=Campylobacter sp. 9BO TaxID=3424759 RepID=UPI003D33FD00